MNKVFENTPTILAAQILLQIIGCNARAMNFYRYPDDEYFPRQKAEYRSGMNWTKYQPLEVIYDFMKELTEKFPNLTDLTTIGETYEKRDLKVLRISENPEDYKKIWIDGGIHAREWISPATVTYVMHQLLTNWKNQPEYMRKLTWYFMPVVNPDGYVYSWNGDRYWRKNRSPTGNLKCLGVDLNRNFDTGWTPTEQSLSDPCQALYPGPLVFSELETQALQKFLMKNKKNLEGYLTFHSYAQILIYPWSYKNESIEDAADFQRVGDLATERIKARTGLDYKAVSGKDYIYLANGTSHDWSRMALGVKYVYTIELRDKGNHGFELPTDHIMPSGQEGFIIVNTVAEAVGA